MAITNTSQISAPVNRVLSTKFLKDARPLLHYFVGSRPGDVLPAHRGSFTMLFRQYDNVTPSVTALTEDTGTLAFPVRTGTQVSVTDVTATVNKYGQHAFLTEELSLRDVTAAGLEIVEIFAVSGGRSLNRLQRNILEDSSTLIYVNGSADSDVVDKISVNAVQQAINALDRNVAMPFTPIATGSQITGSSPMLPAYWGFCHSDVAVDISQLNGFVGVEKYASHTMVMPGEFGALTVAGKAVRFISSSEASIDAGSGGTSTGMRATTGSADLYTTVVIGMNAHGALSLDEELVRETYKSGDRVPGLILIEHDFGSAGVADPMSEIKSIGYKFWHGGAILNSSWSRGIRSAATDLSA